MRAHAEARGGAGGDATQAARTLLSEIERELRPLRIAVNLAQWKATTTGAEEAHEESVRREQELRRYLSDRDRYERIRGLLDSDELTDPLVRRQLELLALDHRPNLLARDALEDLVRRAKEIEAEFVSFRAELDGREVTDNELIRILRTERDGARRQTAWEASKQIGARVADRLLELVRRRNQAATSLGFRDFYAMQMELQEIDEDELLELFRHLQELTDQPFRAAKAEVDARLARRYGTSIDELRPWHYEDPFFQEPPLSDLLDLDEHFRGADLSAIARRFFDGIGLPIDDVLERSDLEERPGKEQHAYCTDIDREGDVRVLCNLQDDERWMGILLHELGHAAYQKYIPRELPWLLRQPAHIATTEGVAMFMDRLIYDVDWLDAAVGTARPDLDRLDSNARQAVRFEALLMARWVPVMTRFERELYARPEPDHLTAVWWALVEELQLLRRPEGRNAPDWAAKIHLTTAPVYYHNYLLGELIASQIAEAAGRQALGGDDPGGWVGRGELGGFLREAFFQPGARLHWQDHLRESTGTRLSLDPFVAQFLDGSP